MQRRVLLCDRVPQAGFCRGELLGRGLAVPAGAGLGGRGRLGRGLGGAELGLEADELLAVELSVFCLAVVVVGRGKGGRRRRFRVASERERVRWGNDGRKRRKEGAERGRERGRERKRESAREKEEKAAAAERRLASRRPPLCPTPWQRRRGVGGGLACGGARSRNSERGRSRRGSDKRRPRWRGTPPLHLLLWRQFPAVAGPSPPPLPCCSRQLLDPKNRCCCFPRLCSAEGDEEEGSGSGQRFWKESEGGKEKDAAAASPSLLPSLVARGNCLTPKTGAAVSRVSGRIKRGPSSKAPTSTSVLCRQSERARPATTRATLLTNGLFLSCSLSLPLSSLSPMKKWSRLRFPRNETARELSLFSLPLPSPFGKKHLLDLHDVLAARHGSHGPACDARL